MYLLEGYKALIQQVRRVINQHTDEAFKLVGILTGEQKQAFGTDNIIWPVIMSHMYIDGINKSTTGFHIVKKYVMDSVPLFEQHNRKLMRVKQ